MSDKNGRVDLEVLLHRHRALVADMWHCACGVKVNNTVDHTNHVAEMLREGGYR